MKKSKGIRLISVVLATMLLLSLLPGCSARIEAREEADTITVYLWSTALYNGYAPYIQEQLPDINIQFVVGNNDLDFYKFMNENGALPDIITCRRFALHDAAELKDNLLDLSTTEAAGAVYDSYLANFTNPDGTVNWLPMCGGLDGFVANRGLFEQYSIPLPTDYDSFVYACREFEKVGIRGFVADFLYDYTCMEILQGLSIPEIVSLKGSMWRSGYEDPADMSVLGLDDTIWPEAFGRMEQFIKDTKLSAADAELGYTSVINMFAEGKAAIIRSGGWNTVEFQNNGVDAVFLPYFGQNGEQWLLTYPQFQVALKGELEKDDARQEKAMRVLNVMLSEKAQNFLSNGGNVIAYSQNIDLHMSPYLDNIQPLIDQNRLYIRIASNGFFSASVNVVTKMLSGEYDAEQAYKAFDSQLRNTENEPGKTVLYQDRGYSYIFHSKGGNQSYSAMANSLREHYGSDVLIAPANSFTGSVFKADYTEKAVGNMIMPNPLEAWHREMTGAELKKTVKAYVEGIEGGFNPINRGSLPTVSGISIEVQEKDGAYALKRVLKDGKEIKDGDTFAVTCLNTEEYMTPLLKDESRDFEKSEKRVKDEWTEYIKGGGTVKGPENYITLK